ncbi:MAG: sensor histidine kinase [Eubacteriales bacterium]|nr:sensor histidine kinase [Eubacteriales bacterium]
MAEKPLELYRDYIEGEPGDILLAPGIIFREMQFLNVLILFVITVVTVHAQRGYIHNGSALSFLVNCGAVPVLFWKLPVCVMILILCLLLLLSIPCNNHPELVIKLLLEYGISIWISALTGFGYTGMVMLLLADAMRYRIDWKKRIAYIIVICVFYVAMSGSFFKSALNVIPIDQMWSYYRVDVRNMFLGILNMLALVNTLIFVLYMVVLTLSQTSEKERILRLNSQLQVANRKLEEYAEEQVRMTETKERNRLAREIHDTLGHSLTGIITGIEACIMLMDIAPEATKEQLRAIAEVARNGITDVRHSVNALRPDALENLDFEQALVKLVEESGKSTGVRIDFSFPGTLKNLDQDEEDVIYRIVQESITNAIRHGRASHIMIRITHSSNDIHIHIADNGKGCNDVHSGFGLHHMKERVEMLKGTISWNGENGFVIDATVPIRVDTEEDS